MKSKKQREWTKADEETARHVLLEPSPFASDGGQMIGRDPRKIPLDQFAAAGITGCKAGGDGLALIRVRCLDCCCQQAEEVRKCIAVTCAAWPYRMGKNPFRRRQLSDEQRKAIGDRLRATRIINADASDHNSEHPSRRSSD